MGGALDGRVHEQLHGLLMTLDWQCFSEKVGQVVYPGAKDQNRSSTSAISKLTTSDDSETVDEVNQRIYKL